MPRSKPVATPAAKSAGAKASTSRPQTKAQAAKKAAAAKRHAQHAKEINEGREAIGAKRTPDNRVLADPLDPKYTELTPLVRSAFLHALAGCGNLTQVCEELRLSVQSVLKWRRENEDFRKAYDDAKREAVHVWEAEAARRAFKGVAKPVYQQTLLVGHVQEYSDKLAEFLLRTGEPTKFNPKTVTEVQHSGSMGIRISSLTNEELDKQIYELLAGMGAVNLSKAEYYKKIGREMPPEEKPDA